MAEERALMGGAARPASGPHRLLSRAAGPAGQGGARESGAGGAPSSPPAIAAPKGGGAIRGLGEKFAANPVTGTASLSVPIALSPGRSGFGPQLSLSYDSGAGNGPFGFGWSLSLSAITRKTDKGLPRYRDAVQSDVFLLSDTEDLVPALAEVGGQWERVVAIRSSGAEDYDVHRYRPRIEGLFARIERWTRRRDGDTHWRVTSADNVTTLYGKTAASRVVDPNDPARVFRWLICESYDDKGNAVVYEYQAEDSVGVDLSQQHEKNRSRSAGRYLKRIKYGNRVSRLIEPDLTRAAWLFEAVFDYDQDHCLDLAFDRDRPEAEQHRLVLAAASPGRPWPARPDPFSSYRAGFEVRTYRRCRRVLMFHRFDELGDEPYLVRSTEFEYQDLDDAPPTAVETELAHQGSTRFASFIRTVTRSGYVRDVNRAALERDGVTYLTYVKRSLPPLELEYSKAVIQDDLREPDSESLGNAPVGLDGATYQWVDLDGEGLSGILTEQPGGWFYKRNLSPLGASPAGAGQPNGIPYAAARFAPLERVAELPSLVTGGGRRRRFLDLAGNGRLDLVELDGAMPGFYERTDDERWAPFLPFASLPVVDWSDPNLRFVDLTGDGCADILVTEDDVFRWYPSLAEDGFAAAERVPRAQDEERGPRLVFADATQSVFLADMCGDGLVDVVRVRNGEVCYWPNLGYGRFGARVGMENAPWLDHPDRFDHRRLRLADVDGSGPTDLIYLGGDGVRLYFNQSGNRWSEPRRLTQFPPVDDLSSVETVDLLGNGTVCLVWSSPSAADARRPLRYIDLVGTQKPHLLIKSVNNLGAETRVHYAPSTRFSLADRLAGKPWMTNIPFPVHVVERVETYDRISGNRFVSRYAYHHGYFDGDDREFRGFALVDQDDTEELAALGARQPLPAGTNEAAASHVPPVRTRTWFHTGAYAGRSHTSEAFAGLLDGRDAGEYYREPGLTDAQARALLLDDTVLPAGLSVEDEREACRALKGSLLRQEIYALDGTDREPHPYVVTEQSFSVEPVQPRSGERHGVFFTHPREALRFDYERDPTDPRVGHALTLAVDRFGNVLRSAAVGYGRRAPDAALPAADQTQQARRFVTCSEHSFTNPIEQEDHYRAPLPSETHTYELTGLRLEGGATRFGFEALAGALDTAAAIPYQQPAGAGQLQKRLIERRRARYRPDDLGASAGEATDLLPVGVLKSLALPGESFRLAFTPDLIEDLFGERVTPDVLSSEGGYVDATGDGDWWLPEGRVFLSAEAGDPPAQELATARAHFFAPRRFRDPFGHEATATADAYDLLAVETRDPLGNTIAAVNDYRTLQPRLIADPNGNRSEVAFDALGLVVGTAVMGKPAEGRGDTLAGFRPDLVEAEVRAHLADPLADPHAILRGATSRQVYDLFAYARTRSEAQPQGAVVYTLTRETHQSDLQPEGLTGVRHAFGYSDGFGREIQQKILAEPGPLTESGPDAGPRWVGSGWTVFDNKGQPVRQFEPFFSATHRFEFDLRRGVSPILCYDPLGRVVVTLHPNHTWQKVVFDPWRQATWDVNDTALIASPAADADVGGSFARLPADDYLPPWYVLRSGGDLGIHELAAATRTATHAETPDVTHTDSLGRAFLTIAHNALKRSDSPAEAPPEARFQRTRIVLDVEGNQREVVDARERVVVRYGYDMLGHRVTCSGMESGARCVLDDVTGKPVRSWDGRGHTVRTEYDALRRPLCARVSGSDPARSDPRVLGREVLFTRIEYGEGQPDDVALNLRTRMCRLHDGAGTVSSDAYDFKGNLLRGSRRLARDYKGLPDWAGEVPLEEGSYTSSTTYDALNRPVTATSPDGSVVRPQYNAAGLLERIDANLRGETQDGEAVWTPFVGDVDYNARGQRERIDLGNGASTQYVYDPLTLRLTRLFTARNATAFPDDCPSAPPAGWPGCAVQNLTYTYDPVGNISRIQDDAQQTIFFRNRRVEPSNDFLYDSTYQLVEATGREHLGQIGGLAAAPDAANGFHSSHLHPGDGQAMGPYREGYVYDPAGNIRQLIHEAGAGSWTRDYVYAEISLLEAGEHGNRLTSTRVGSGPVEPYTHDAHGNMSRMPRLPLMRWTFLDQLQASSQQAVSSGAPETTYYVYDAAGQRVRKVTERRAAAGDTAAREDERVYLGGFEVYRAYAGDGVTTTLERETLHVMDDTQRVALVETRTHGEDGSAARLTRYQLGNHLGSASVELDEAGRIISYEEFYPYGSASYQAVDATVRAAAKRYRYTAMERDEETGLAYHGARYYADWLGRWTSADPLGIRDTLDVYQYVSGNPVRLKDPTGREDEEDTLGELASDVLHGVKTGPINTSSVGHYDLEFSIIPFENALKRNSNPSKVPFPEEFGMHVNGDPAYPAWKHALEDVPGNPNSPWISATRNLEASSFRGTEYLIDADQLTEFLDHPQVVQEVKDAIARGDLNPERGQRWLDSQVKGAVEMETLIKNDVPAEAIRRMDQLKKVVVSAEQIDVSTGVRLLKTYGPRFARGANAVGAVMTVVDVATAAKASYDVGNPKPLAAEAVRQGFAWGGGIVGTFVGAVGGAAAGSGGTASFTWETGPLGIGLTVAGGGTGAVVGGVAGNVGGSFAGYALGDWLADTYIHPN